MSFLSAKSRRKSGESEWRNGRRGGKLTPAAPSNTIIQNSNTQREENAFEMAAKKSVQFRPVYMYTFPFCRIDRAPISECMCVWNGDGIQDEFSMSKLFGNCVRRVIM